MNIFKSLSDFLYDKEYFIALFDKQIYIYNYNELIFLSSEKIIVGIDSFKIILKGRELIIKQMDKRELLIAGEINEVIKGNE